MTKRPPEMETLARVPHYEVRLARNDGFDSYTAPAYLAEHADAAIRSLRVKLFRERAKLWNGRGVDLRKRGMLKFSEAARVGYDTIADRCFKRAARFARLADAIERGEK